MVLITDGGSTKCDWVLLDIKGNQVFKTRTKGLNPTVLSEEVLKERIQSNVELQSVFLKVKKIDFYGAGCGTKTPSKNLKKVIEDFFVNANVTVAEDTVAAVRAATTTPSIVCVLGTGSNSCYFDGKNITVAIASLGYILMDEASGNYFGKRLIRDYYYNKMPSELAKEFETRFDVRANVIKNNIYKKSNPNTYLASFAEFIFTSKEVNGYFYKLISEGITKFLENKVLCYKEAQQVPVHFIGSIAHFSKEIIEDCMKPYHLKLGKIIRRPIEGLIEYYQKQDLSKYY